MTAGTREFDLVTTQLVIDGTVVVIPLHHSRPLPGGTGHPGTQAGDEGAVRFGRSDDLAGLLVGQARAGETFHHAGGVGRHR